MTDAQLIRHYRAAAAALLAEADKLESRSRTADSGNHRTHDGAVELPGTYRHYGNKIVARVGRTLDAVRPAAHIHDQRSLNAANHAFWKGRAWPS